MGSAKPAALSPWGTVRDGQAGYAAEHQINPRLIVDAAVDTIAGGTPDQVRANYQSSFAGERFVESMRYPRRYPEELPSSSTRDCPTVAW